MPLVAVFGSSTCIEGDFEYDSAFLIGSTLAKSGIGIITGGYCGVMEAALKGASSYNTPRIGILLENSPKVKNKYVNRTIKVKSYLERLGILIETADSFAILPGGSGTILEFAALIALLERKQLKNKYVAALGYQWVEIFSLFDKYSGNFNVNTKLINHFETAAALAGFLIDYLME